MNKNSIHIDKMLTVGYAMNKEVTAGMLKTPLMIIKVSGKQIYIVDVMGSVVKWAYCTTSKNSKSHLGMVRTTKMFSHSGHRCIRIKGNIIKL